MDRVTILFFVIFLHFSAVSDAQWRRHIIDDSSSGADGVRVEDVNGDGYLDLTTGWEEGGLVRVTMNPGPAALSCCEGSNRSVFIHWAPREREQYLETQAWTTAYFPATRKKQSWMFASALDVDGMNGVDLVIGSKGSDASVGWLQAPKNPRVLTDWKFHRVYDAGWIMTIATHDVDGDGDMDVLVSDRTGSAAGVKWLEHPGSLVAMKGGAWKEHQIGAKGKEVMFLRVADLDGDGLEDVICTNRNGQMDWFRRKAGEQVEWDTHSFDLPFGMPFGKSLAIGDIDLDGRMDVVTTNRGSEPAKCVAWQSWNESPVKRKWNEHDIGGTEGSKFDLIELIDLDKDGDLDVVTCEEAAGLGVIWYENPSRKP